MFMDKTANAVALFDKYASEYEVRFMDTAMYHDTFNLFCETIGKPDACILELACGPGNITRYLLQQRPAYQITATDLSDNMLAIAQQNAPNAHFQKMDCRQIGSLAARFDGIMCGFCLPYLSVDEVTKLIADAAQLLHVGGVLYLSTMEDDYSRSGLATSSKGDSLWMHYYEGERLTNLLEAHGFELLETHRKCYTPPGGKDTTDLIIIAKKL